MLLFDPFESVVRTDNFYSKIERKLINDHFQTLFLSVLAVNYVVADGKVRRLFLYPSLKRGADTRILSVKLA